MPALEAVALVFGFTLAALSLFRTSALLLRTCYFGLLLALCVQLVAQGPFWQAIPLYLSAAATPFFLNRAGGQAATRISFALLSFCLLTASAALSILLPLFHLPPPTGPQPVATRILHLVDQSRPDLGGHFKSGHRELMVQAWYPASASTVGYRREPYRRSVEVTYLSSYMSSIATNSFSSAPIASSAEAYPVILFNPAWKGQRTECVYLMEELASHGFVVVAVDHTYNSGPVAFPDGTRILSTPVQDIDDFSGRDLATQQRQGDAEVRLEAQDDSFVLDELARLKTAGGDPWFSRLDSKRVGVIGHSFGGAVALQTAYLDQRVVSAINMDGWAFGEPAHATLQKPTMQMDEDIRWPSVEAMPHLDHDTRLYWQLSMDDARFRSASLAAGGGYRVTIRGSRHMDFADRSLYSPIKSWTDAGTISPTHAHAIVRRFVEAFFSQTLRGTSQALLEPGAAQDRDVVVQVFTPQHPLEVKTASIAGSQATQPRLR